MCTVQYFQELIDKPPKFVMILDHKFINNTKSNQQHQQDTPWAEHAPESVGGYPIYSCCYACADIVGRIRPGMTLDVAKECYDNTHGSSDPSLRDDFDSAKLNMAEEELEAFRPGAHITRAKSYALDVFQDFACLTAEEFWKLTSLTPVQARVDPIELSAYPKGTKQFFLLSLEGLSCSQIASVRKVRIRYGDAASSEAVFLRPEDQLLENQGLFVMPYVLGKHMAERPEALQNARPLTKPVPSVQDLQKRKSEEDAAEVARLKAASAKIEREENRDDFDEVLDEMEAGQAEEISVQVAKMRRRPGLEAAPKTVPRAPKKHAAAKGGVTPSTVAPSEASSGTPHAQSASTHVHALQDVGESTGVKKGNSQSGKAKLSVSDLDPEMQQVAEKHLSSDKGSSINSLHQLNVEFFLVEYDEGQKRYAQSAKLKGVSSLVSQTHQQILYGR